MVLSDKECPQMKKYAWLLAACLLFANAAFLRAGEQVYTIKIIYVQAENDPLTIGLKELSNRLKERSAGRINFEVYSSSILGDTSDGLEQARGGSNIGVITDAGRFSDFLPEIGSIDMPFLFDTFDEGNAIVHSDLFKSWADRMPERGYRVLSFNWYQGPRCFATVRPINTMADMKNMKVRTTSAKIALSIMRHLGMLPSSFPMAEVYLGLQQGVIEAADQHIMGIYGNKLYEVAPYVTVTGHFQVLTGLVVGESWFQSLPDDLKAILLEESDKAGEYASRLTEKRISEMSDEMEKMRVSINRNIDTTEMRAATVTVDSEFPGYPEIRAQFNKLLGK
jgi:tripartite ATP-independent transporter DctP family solute receptor